jgi:hypothetical protein
LLSITSSAQIKTGTETPFFSQKNQSQNSVSSLERILKGDPNNFVITAEHTSKVSGVRHIYLRQAILGIQVDGTESSLHLDAQGKTIVSHNKFIPTLSETLTNQSISLSQKDAVLSVANKMGYPLENLNELERKGGVHQEVLFNKAGISSTEIPVRLLYLYEEGVGTRLVWELSVQELTSSDWWNFKVDAGTGAILRKDNFTVSCFNEVHDHPDDISESDDKNEEARYNYNVENNPTLLVGAYNVIPLPIESPNHGTRSLISNPDNATASPYGWHDTNGVPGAEFTRTQGNNCAAYDDDNDTNSPSNPNDYAEGGASLLFDFPFNPTYTGGNQSEDAAVTNLFYWTNIIHDIIYQYGMDEASGNFQENNYGNGGAGSDSVNSEAQDGSGTCNANFGTPTDGNNPRMQMYVCGSRDGDFDNGVIVHEFAHGISNRLTGGPGNTSCLFNEEQMGEGWSDFYALMLTMENGDVGTDSRGMGTWLIGQGAGGGGIRTYPYSTNFAVNPHTYNAIKTAAVPHGVGSVWAAMLWEMTWELIDDHGFDADIYSFTGDANIDAGNIQALALVTEGLKLQPCSPGFVDGRDAILLADQNIYGGANQCAIWDAFARRGLGASATQGLTSSRSDGTEAFDVPVGTGGFENTLSEVCITQGIQSGLSGGSPAGGIYSGNGVTDGGDGSTYTFDPTVAGVGDTVVTYSIADACSGGAVSNYNEIISVTDGLPDLVCQDVNINLDAGGNASIVWQDVVANTIPGGYSYEVIPNTPATLTGGATSVSLADDNGTGAIPIGFNFEFYKTNYTNFYIASNGFVSFTGNGMTGPPSWTPTALPNSGVPNGMICGVWDDLSPNIGGTIKYQSFGTAPNRKMVIEFNAVRLYGSTKTVTFQIHLNETTNIIYAYLINVQSDGTARTFGLENAAGDMGITDPATNLGNWTATDVARAFVPQPDVVADNCGNSVGISLSKTDFTCLDVGTNIITVTADDGAGGISTCNATVTVIGETTTYAGGSWNNGIPDASKNARFSQNYSTNSGNIDACSCEIDPGVTVTVEADDHLNILGNITNDGTLIIEHQGSVVQTDDAAFVTNNGTINVNLTTPDLASRDFMILGSPMTAEDRNSVWNSAFLVLEHDTNLFVPNPDVEAQMPGAENFADDNYDNWIAYTGPINVGEGYIVRPQSGYGQPGGIFNYTYEGGTLNNGEITFEVLYNTPGPTAGDNKNASPNVLANPYPSAIWANDFINANTMINEVFFWEHLTPPSSSIPGAGAMNFDMQDISMYNLEGGTAAPSDPGTSTQPNGYISTGQGFGIKASAAGTAIFNNSMRRTSGNTTLRGPVNDDRERIWVKLSLPQYELQNTTLIGFSENTTEGLDNGYDSRRLATVLSLYSHLEDGSQQLGIQTREAFESGVKVPLGFSSQVEEEVEYEISIASLEGAELTSATVYLMDNYENVVVDLNDGPYTFKSNSGTFHNRFTLLFEGAVVVLNQNDSALNAISIFPNPAQNNIHIVSPVASVEQVLVYDLQGRTVLKSEEQGTVVQLNLSYLGSSMYFVEITTEFGKLTKRIIKK